MSKEKWSAVLSVMSLFLAALVIISASLYFYILIDFKSDDLEQMRRIILFGTIAFLSGGIFISLVVLFWLKSLYLIFSSKIKSSILLTAVICSFLATVTFQLKLPDAFRHAYASALISYYVDPGLAYDLGNLVEWTTSYKKTFCLTAVWISVITVRVVKQQ